MGASHAIKAAKDRSPSVTERQVSGALGLVRSSSVGRGPYECGGSDGDAHDRSEEGVVVRDRREGALRQTLSTWAPLRSLITQENSKRASYGARPSYSVESFPSRPPHVSSCSLPSLHTQTAAPESSTLVVAHLLDHGSEVNVADNACYHTWTLLRQR